MVEEEVDLNSKLSRLTAAIERGIDLEEVKDKITAYQARRNAIRSQLVLLKHLTEEKKKRFDLDMITGRVKASREILNSRTVDAMREELQKHIVSITVYKTGKGEVLTRRFGLFEGQDFSLVLIIGATPDAQHCTT